MVLVRESSKESKKQQLVDNALSTTIVANRVVANYRLVDIRGTGGMANIYKAIQLSLDRPVALKIMHPHFLNNEAFIARFEKEAKSAALLHHENIVSIIDYGCDNGEYYIAMEYIDGISLGEVIRKQPRMPLEVALHICHQVAEGLKYAHGMGLVHRDIKPANIMLSFDGRVMITDFGIAKTNGDMSITSTGQVMGSPSYMSPEQAAGRTLDHRSDLFSLGIIFYEIIAGEKPFKGETYQNLITSIMSDCPRPLQEFRPDINRELDELAQKALIKMADSRFQTAEEFSEAIMAQLSKFKIQSSRKMMADYLKNPIKTAEKLRADKVSDHMESALYYLAVGEGKLAEAKREFLDVLRYDRGNKEAQKYLAKLELQLPSEKTKIRNTYPKISNWLAYGLTGVTAIALAVLTIFSFKSKDNSVQSSDIPISFGFIGPLPDSTFALGTDIGLDGNTIQAALSPSTERLSSGTTTEKSSSNSSIKPTPPSTRRSVSKTPMVTYPNQEIDRFGTVKVVTSVPASLRIDNKPFGLANGPMIKLAPGRHIVEVSADGYQESTKRILVKAGQIDTVLFTLSAKKPRR